MTRQRRKPVDQTVKAWKEFYAHEEQFAKASLAAWSYSLPLGRFTISVPMPLEKEDGELILEIMELVKKQITRRARLDHV